MMWRQSTFKQIYWVQITIKVNKTVRANLAKKIEKSDF